MSSSQRREESHEEQVLTSRTALELVCLGIAVGSLEWRELVEPKDWGDTDLKKWLFDVAGVQWKGGKPVPAMLEKLKRNTCRHRVIQVLTRLKETSGYQLDLDLDKFFAIISAAYDEAIPEIETMLKGKKK